jgi:hypothetical protein
MKDKDEAKNIKIPTTSTFLSILTILKRLSAIKSIKLSKLTIFLSPLKINSVSSTKLTLAKFSIPPAKMSPFHYRKAKTYLNRNI